MLLMETTCMKDQLKRLECLKGAQGFYTPQMGAVCTCRGISYLRC